jgi:peptidoglycan/xylan/chitin deacetylase (PgdA/CDA1 family)
MRRAGAISFAAATIAASCLSGALLAAAPARAENCPGNPNALGTSRVLVVGPKEYGLLGTMQYKQTLPLADHEVVITFDDGPLPPWSDKALDILTSQCVKATYFIVGEMARAFPQVVRREYEAGYTIGTHSENHPLRFESLTGDKLNYQIDGGIASVSAALGDPDDLAPFFRIPGLGRSAAVEQALAARSLVVFSADVVADDWFRHITPAQIIQRAMSRLEKSGRGILLLHDIHPWTVAALPGLLQQLKDHGFHVVQVVPPAPSGPLMAGGPKAWALAAAMPRADMVDMGARSPAWPQTDASLAPDGSALPAPDEGAFDVDAALGHVSGLAADQVDALEWPERSDIALPSSDAELASPGLPDIGVSLHGENLVGADLGLRPSDDDVPTATEHGRWRHVRLHGRHPAPKRASVEGQHADLPSGIRALASLLTEQH